ncbi:MAG: riboflavin synthase [Bacteroidia bacterium]
MFTGIVECTGKIVSVENNYSNIDLWIESPVSHELKIDQSVSHNGVCLTVTDVKNNAHKVTAVAETINKSNIGKLTVNSIINLERCMPANGRFDGHIVQGHVDTTAIVNNIKDLNGSWLLDFEINDTKFNHLMVDKGSICINGVSLTIISVNENKFNVTIIPYTWQHTNFNALKVGDLVNIEFDIVGKYIQKMLSRT